MRPLHGVYCLVTFLTFYGDIQGGGLIAQIPPEGGWVRYSVLGTSREGQVWPAGTLTIRSLGSDELQGRRCRWLEFKMDFAEDKADHCLLVKLLIPDADLKPGVDLMQRSVKRLFQVDSEPPVENISPNTRPEWLLRVEQMFTMGCEPEPSRESSALEEKTIEYQRGKLTRCRGAKQEVASKVSKATVNGIEVELQQKMQRSVWYHREVPFGVAACEATHSFLRDGKVQGTIAVNFLLSDFGADTKTTSQESK